MTFTTPWPLVPGAGQRINVDPYYDIVSMNDGCFTLVTKSLNALQDPHTGFLIVDCGLLKTGPDVKLSFGGHVFTLSPESYIFQDTASGVCTALFVNTPGTLLLGAPFLIEYYSLYDISNSRFGFAKAIHPKYYPRHNTTN
ncbi:hypothetical protein HDU76_005932 [Blyttiomyces sp. JEL0837]|nr:hypothetical protein HDU76_005932 [Blyttiomyces sp. JEL0837]